MDKKLKCPKCGNDKRVKSGFNNKKQRYLCKECKCHYTVSQRGYPEHIRRKAIQLYLEGNGFRRIERIIKVSHVSVINWVKKAGAKLEEVPKKNEKVDVLELDELCVNKKNIWFWTAVGRATKRIVGFQIGTRKTKHLQKFAHKISYIDANFMRLIIGVPTISSTRPNISLGKHPHILSST